MGLYNVVFGVNPRAGELLGALGLTNEAVGRFRDAWVTEDAQQIAIYTRNGGNNREHYMPDFSKHPLYLRDVDDTFDNTYATIFFRVPESFRETAASMAQSRNPDREWKEALAIVGTGKDPKLDARLAPLAQQLKRALLGGD